MISKVTPIIIRSNKSVLVLTFQTLSSGAEDTSVVVGEPERGDGSGTPLSSFAGGGGGSGSEGGVENIPMLAASLLPATALA